MFVLWHPRNMNIDGNYNYYSNCTHPHQAHSTQYSGRVSTYLEHLNYCYLLKWIAVASIIAPSPTELGLRFPTYALKLSCL